MSMHDALYLNSTLGIEGTLRKFAELLDDPDEVYVERDYHNAKFWRPEAFLATAFAEHPSSADSITDNLGIIPNVRIIFRLNKWGEWDAIREGILKSTLHLVQNTDWDMALRQYDSKIILLRRSGKVLVKKGYDFWTEERLELLTIPYEIAEITNL